MPPRRRLNPVPTQRGRTVLYVRVSALMGRSGDDFHSPAVQIDAMRRAVTNAGLREVAVIDDDIDVSGRGFDRKGLDRIRAMVTAGEADVVAVHELSRVGRNLSEALEFIRWLRKHGASILSAQEEIRDTPEGQFMVGMWLNMAELYGNQMARRWAQILERRARLGKPHGHAPQGYLRVDGNYVIDPELGPAITAMFTSYANGDFVGDIADAFAAARGRPVHRVSLKRMLRNPIYVGRVVLNSKTGGTMNLPGVQPPLVDQTTWDRVQRRMGEDRILPPRFLAPRHELTGLALCWHCTHHLQVKYDNNRHSTLRYYCPQQVHSRSCQGVGTPRYDGVLGGVLDEVRAYAARLRGNPAARAALQARAARAVVDVKQMERDLARTREALTKLAEGWARGMVPDGTYQETLDRLRATEQQQSGRLSAAKVQSEAPDPGEVVILVDRMFDLWPDMEKDDRNRVLKSVLTSFTVRRGQRWREPEDERLGDFVFRW